MEKLTEDDINMLDYFWAEKEDLERWVGWEDRKDFIKNVKPELIEAWENYKKSKETISRIIKEL